MSADKPKRSQELVPLPAAPLAPATQAPEPPVTQISLKEIQAYVAEHCRNQLGEPIRDWKPQNILAQMSVDPNIKPETRAKCASDVLSYLHPRLRGIEIESHHEETHTFIVKKEFSFAGEVIEVKED